MAVPSPRFRVLLIPFFLAAALLTGLVGCDEIFAPCKDGDPCWTPPPSHRAPARSPSEVIEALRDAYQRRDYELFYGLFSDVCDGPPYLFLTGDSLGTTWPLLEELRLHRRMFRPEDVLPGETPVPPELWIAAIDIVVQPSTKWLERGDLYRSESNPSGLDPGRWRASAAQYEALVYLETQGETDFQVTCHAEFVVLENLAKPPGEDCKFLIYRWADLGGWTAVKQIGR